jgi:NTP pyrophosphatase (non-canonical NTP hydrolase)
MNEKEKRKLYGQCLDKWGPNSQIDMCIEEMSELIQALCKAKRYEKPDNWLAQVYEEIADVTIMLEQVTSIFDGDEVVPTVIKRKLKRLVEMVQK